MRKITTTRFGEIEEDEGKIVHFAAGLPAFEDEHEFIIVPYDEESPYVFLQSAATPDLAFLMTIPGSDIREMTANLLAPVVINSRTNEGCQVVLDKSDYRTKHKLFSKKEQTEEKKESEREAN